MNDQSKEVPMTLEGNKILTEELDHLIKVEREQIKKAIADARALGDLKENADYHAAKERQSHIEGRVLELQSKLSRANVVDVTKIQNNKIIFGATVTLYDVAKESSITYQIVGEDEAQLDSKKISYASPLGRSLIGKEEGDEVIVKAPKGDVEYEVEAVEYI